MSANHVERTLAAFFASAACLSGCGIRHVSAPTYGRDKCPPLPVSAPPLGVTKLAVADTIDNLAPPGSPLNLKPEWRSDNPRNPGVCVDAVTGDIHLYGSKTRSVTFLLGFNPALSLSAIWPVNPADAVLTSEGSNGPWTRSQFKSTFIGGHRLQFTVAYEHGRKPYYYRLQYADPDDPEDIPRPIQAMIFNH